MNERIVRLADAKATQHLGIELGKSLTAGSVLLLTGDLGSGKTTLVQGLAQGMGIEDSIVSPTFTIINEYSKARLPLYHLDLYRLNPAEVDDLQLESYWLGLETELGIVAIEWAERLSHLPSNYIQIELTYDPIEGRIAKISTIERI
ncbi:tRNA (adenosine(37)-N6)-threonylcarbamoyltransferase complex ATPase subunit type 1 TsaE [Chamaesiphon sp. GL140_3_metabinner_50]|uniref:tRNA (adenosine(37)-N6)-threonylcarbamoyltransferase complex ATPase subunit type 1 TsaE n=1 Tax=Chamaesiphon sp. GL140_3_metabinner_50 TaxID=2970812 RepID=UPI0025E5D0DE|nr:tRNA (adenosine(37)-N6)-threonylcarbamoyltransferase complex ATPase subunit type 1 TsaE [Chamaesiphon sp. GL140_3_metabinner_50]